MGMQQYDAKCGNGLLNPISLNKFLQAVSLYYKSGECVAEFQAYLRGNPASGQVTQQALTNSFNNRPQPPGLTIPNDKLQLYAIADAYFNTTIKPGGEARLTTEKQTRKTYWTTGLGKGKLPSLYEYAAHGLDSKFAAHLTTPKQAEGYVRLLGTIVEPFAVETAHNRNNQTLVQAKKAVQAINAIRNNLVAFRLDDGSLNEAAPQWVTFDACVDYWTKELGRQEVRRPHVTTLGTTAPNGTEAKLYRLISGGEKDFIEANGKVAQGPKGTSYERHKWFFYGDGAPSVGHEWKLEVKLSKNILDYMLDNAVECGEEKADSTQAFIKKSNEHDCLGIHEDVLQPLHAKLTGFVLVNNKTKGATKTVAVKA